MEVYECIRKRRSIRSYNEQPVSDEVVEEVLEAARMAPSAQNRQEWAFVVVRNKEIKQQVMEAAAQIETTITRPAWKRLQVGGEPLQVLTQAISKMVGKTVTADNIQSLDDLDDLLEQYTRVGVRSLFNADVIIAVYRNVSSGMSVATSNSFDIGAAIQNMLLVATSHGLGSLWAGGFSRKETKTEYKAIGPAVREFYRDRISEILQAPKDMDLAALVFIGKSAVEAPEPSRKPLNEIAFLDAYGKPWKKD